MKERAEVVLIGPIGAGKSTIGALLAETLGMPQVSLDDIRFDYFREIGFSSHPSNKLLAKHIVYWRGLSPE